MKVFFVFNLAWLLPFVAWWIVGRLRHYMISLIIRAKKERSVRNDLYSCLYFVEDLGPNVSGYAVLAIIVTNHDHWWQLVLAFFAGILMKRMGRRLRGKLAKMLGE